MENWKLRRLDSKRPTSVIADFSPSFGPFFPFTKNSRSSLVSSWFSMKYCENSRVQKDSIASTTKPSVISQWQHKVSYLGNYHFEKNFRQQEITFADFIKIFSSPFSAYTFQNLGKASCSLSHFGSHLEISTFFIYSRDNQDSARERKLGTTNRIWRNSRWRLFTCIFQDIRKIKAKLFGQIPTLVD